MRRRRRETNLWLRSLRQASLEAVKPALVDDEVVEALDQESIKNAATHDMQATQIYRYAATHEIIEVPYVVWVWGLWRFEGLMLNSWRLACSGCLPPLVLKKAGSVRSCLLRSGGGLDVMRSGVWLIDADRGD
ncbi:hypothetical protein Dimus_028466 [Dionaea muscipula]